MTSVVWQVRRPAVLTAVCTVAFVCAGALGGGGRTPNDSATTLHASGPGELWLAPEPGMVTARAALARAVASLAEGRAADALPVFSGAVDDPDLGAYARLYAGRAHLALSRAEDAAAAAAAVLAESPSDALAEAALNVAAEAATLADDPQAVIAALKDLVARPNAAPASTNLRLLRAALDVSDRELARSAFRRLYYDYAGSSESNEAIAEMKKAGIAPPAPARDDYARDLTRAERLFSLRQYTDARAAFVALQPVVAAGDRPLVDLRIAESDLFLKKHATAAAGLRAYLDKATTRVPEAEYHYLTAVRELGRTDEYLTLLRAFVDRGADPVLAERALNDLGTYYILENDDRAAAEVFTDQYARFPQGAFADRAAWKAGWWAYKSGEYAETIRLFESAAAGLRRADYRPAWLYWAARSHLQLGHRDAALEAFRRVIADYRNSYYGRAAVQEAGRIQAAMRPAGAGPVSPARLTWPATIAPSPRPANASVIEHLLAAGMYDEAIAELRRLQATGQGSSLVDATLAFALNRQGKLRPAITAMRRAYPQFMAEGGEALPQEILTVIFPLEYWNLLFSHATAKRLDPFLVAALVAQESTFQADVRSAANAWGLMQIIPATGRRYASALGIRPFSTTRLVHPETNVLIGTTYFADLLKRFGDTAPALAAYNAGEQRVSRWLAERPGVDRDEFIDDIPFPETQNYVKRILGTAEDYRILYGNGRR